MLTQPELKGTNPEGYGYAKTTLRISCLWAHQQDRELVYGDQNFDTVYFNEELAFDFTPGWLGTPMELSKMVQLLSIRDRIWLLVGPVYALVCNNQTYIKQGHREENESTSGLLSIPNHKDIFISYEEDPRIVGIIVRVLPMEAGATLIIPESHDIVFCRYEKSFMPVSSVVKRGLHPLKTLTFVSWVADNLALI